MRFSKTELNAIAEMGKGNKSVSGIAKALKISSSQVYRLAQKLSQKGILKLEKSNLLPERKTHVNMLLRLLSRAANLSTPLSGTGFRIYTAFLEPKTRSQAQKETGLPKMTFIKKISQGRKMSLLLIKNRTYRINEKIWPDAKECLAEFRKYEESIDQRGPVNSIIYYKNNTEIVFSNREEIDATQTAFSTYENYGIGLLPITYYYYLPKKKLSKIEVFLHSLYATQKDKDIRNIIFVALYYAKYRKELKRISHPIIENIKRVLAGEKVQNYPTRDEIRD